MHRSIAAMLVLVILTVACISGGREAVASEETNPISPTPSDDTTNSDGRESAPHLNIAAKLPPAPELSPTASVTQSPTYPSLEQAAALRSHFHLDVDFDWRKYSSILNGASFEPVPQQALDLYLGIDWRKYSLIPFGGSRDANTVTLPGDFTDYTEVAGYGVQAWGFQNVMTKNFRGGVWKIAVGGGVALLSWWLD